MLKQGSTLITLFNFNYLFLCPISKYCHTRVMAGEGNGTPLQHSYLENPIDGGAW